MQKLHIAIDAFQVDMTATTTEKTVKILQIQSGNHPIEKKIQIYGNHYFFLYSGALVVPLIWLRGYDFSQFEKTTYQVLPVGMAEILQIEENDAKQNIRHFSVLMQSQGFTDILNVQSDLNGKVLNYQSKLNQLAVKLQL